MILPERVFGMSGTITTRRGRAMGPISRILHTLADFLARLLPRLE
jgi:hypothetical protein